MANEFWTTFRVFLWKIVKEKQFYWKKNLFYTLLPVLFIWLPLFLLSRLDNAEPTTKHDEIFSPETKDQLYEINLANEVIYYTPRNNITSFIMERARLKLRLKDEDVRGLENDFQLQPILDDEDNNRFIIVNFDVKTNVTTLPTNITYTLRVRHNDLKTDEEYLESVRDSYFVPEVYEYMDFPYRRSGFLTVKLALDEIIINTLAQQATNFDISINKYPQKAGPRPEKVEFGAIALPLAIMFVSLYVYLIILPSIEIKATGFQEHLKNASRFSYLNGVIIYMVNLFQILLMLVFCFVILWFYQVFGCMCISFPLIFSILFVTAMMSYTFLLRATFNSIVCATICAPLCYLIPIFVFRYISQPGLKTLEVFFPVNNFLHGTQLFQDYLNAEHCFGWADINRHTHPNGAYTFLQLCLSMIASAFLYLGLAWFVASLFPGQYGTPINLFDFFGNSEEKVGPDVEACPMANDDGRSRKIETIVNGRTIVKISRLGKIFKSLFGPPNVVVRDFSLNIYEHQITALLGHNGAGKTTTMCMLTGMLPRSSGTISVDGDQNVHSYRTVIGFCPQHNIFIPYLTCMEHLLFFGQLRGLTAAKAAEQAKQILCDINLSTKADVPAHTLSGGMKRRLSLANAIIGETKLLVLDEPSSGLDPESRRELWDVLLRLKKNHSILITTHYMEEADVLGDKIAIMENGEVISYGTPMFLKKEYGNGYTLKMLKKDINSFRCGRVLDLIHETIPGAKVKDSIDALFCVVLPYEDQEDYVRVLEYLEGKKQELGIESISITNTTLEEVFLNSAAHDKKNTTDRCETDSSVDLFSDSTLIQSGVQRPEVMQQMLAIQYKNLVYWRRNWISLISMFVILSFSLLIIFYSAPNPNDTQFKTTKISMEELLDPVVLFVHLTPTDKPTMQTLIELFRQNVERDHAILEIHDEAEVTDLILEMAKNNKFKYNENLAAAFEVGVDESNHITINAFYSRNIIHSISIALNLATNVLTQFYSKQNYTIDVINAPILRYDAFSSKFLSLLMYAYIIPFAFVCVLFIFIRLPYNEYWTKSKQIQNISVYVYWIGNYATDLVLFFFLSAFVVIFSIILDRNEMFTSNDYAELLPIFFAFGAVYLVLVYVVSQVFSTINGSITFLSYLQLLNMFAGLILNIPGVRESYAALVSIFYLMPDFAFRQIMFAFADQKKFDNLLTGKPVDYVKYYVSLLLSAVILFSILLYVCENIYVRDRLSTYCFRWKKMWACKKKKSGKNVDCDEVDGLRCYGDDDVDREKELVQKLTTNRIKQEEENYSVVVSKLEKSYNDFPAVRGLDFAVQKGDCFGLLGMNGAGKTTTFNMMTLCETISSGSIEVNKLNCRNDKLLYKSQFGYCPQVDALNPLMTAYEILKYFAWIRGVPRQNLPNVVDHWLQRVDIDEFRDRQVQYFSGGTKRKLNTAVAMIGFPSLIFLDEPTTGVDPKSRRYVWNCIKDFQNQKKTVVLTSHSMDECENLCNRLAIMNEGHFTCIGGIQQLKNKYGNGFTLTIKLLQPYQDREEELMRLKQDIAGYFKSTLKDEHGGLLYYFINNPNIVWSSVFRKILQLQENHLIFDDFSINEIGLEEIFMQFRKDIKKPNTESTNF